jgi:type IV pilus assembly protein PilC
MPVFEYKALLANGSPTNGKLEANGRQDALRVLEERGFTPVRIAETGGSKPRTQTVAKAAPAGEKKQFFASKKVPFAVLEDFTRSLSSLLAANVPLSRALVILAQETQHPAAKKAWQSLHDMVVDGVALADAMARLPETFPRIYVAMVAAGEAGGFLDVVLGQISDFQAREKEMRGKVTAALVYPAVLLFLAIGVLIFLLAFFIPRFMKLFANSNQALPMITQVIIAASDLMRSYGIYIAVIVGGAIWFGRKWLASEKNQRLWEGTLLKMPVVGPLAAQIAMARFCRMLGTLLAAGVSLVSALGVARRSLGNRTLIDLVNDSTERVTKGESLGAALGECKALFPGSTLEMIKVAEESGRLEHELVRLAGVTEITLDRQMKMAVALAEPIMLFFIAGFIGTIFIAMVLPIFSIQDSIK